MDVAFNECIKIRSHMMKFLQFLLYILFYFFCNTDNILSNNFFSIQNMYLFSFQPTGDHLPLAPPAPAHAQLAAVQAAQYNTKNYDLGNAGAGAGESFDDGQYDPRYNDPNFEGNQGSQAYVQPAQPQYVPQAQPQPQQQAQPQAYNNLNSINYIAQYQSTTPHPHRFQPPGNQIFILLVN